MDLEPRMGIYACVSEGFWRKRPLIIKSRLTDADLEAIAEAQVPPEYHHLDAEYED
jgi:hypothetical protein